MVENVTYGLDSDFEFGDWSKETVNGLPKRPPLGTHWYQFLRNSAPHVQSFRRNLWWNFAWITNTTLNSFVYSFKALFFDKSLLALEEIHATSLPLRTTVTGNTDYCEALRSACRGFESFCQWSFPHFSAFIRQISPCRHSGLLCYLWPRWNHQNIGNFSSVLEWHDSNGVTEFTYHSNFRVWATKIQKMRFRNTTSGVKRINRVMFLV